MSHGGCLLPLSNKNQKQVSIAMYKKREATTFFSLSDEAHTVMLFVETLKQSGYEDAKAYISKNMTEKFDPDALTCFFEKAKRYKNLIEVNFQKAPTGCATNSILVLRGDSRKNSMVHFRLVKEPNRFGKWKIYGIDTKE